MTPNVVSICGCRAAAIQDEIPGGLESGIGWFVFNPSDGHGDTGEEPIYTAEWNMASGGGQIDFVVTKRAPGTAKPDYWPEPLGLKNVVRTNKGTVVVSGLKFSAVQWTGNFKDAATASNNLFGVDYSTRDSDGMFVGLRGFGMGTPAATEHLTTSVLKTLQKVPTKYTSKRPNPSEPDSTEPYELIMP